MFRVALLFRQERAEYQKSAKRTAVERAARLQAQLDKQAAEAADVADGKTPTAQDDKTSEMAKELEEALQTAADATAMAVSHRLCS